MGEVPPHPGRIGPYQIVRRLGAGGMGVVYLGHNEAGAQAAVKLIRSEFVADPVFRARLRREVDAARRVPRSCTAPLLAADLEAATPWVATEYIDGPSLDVVLVGRGRLSGPELVGLAVGVAVALRAIHAHGSSTGTSSPRISCSRGTARGSSTSGSPESRTPPRSSPN